MQDSNHEAKDLAHLSHLVKIKFNDFLLLHFQRMVGGVNYPY